MNSLTELYQEIKLFAENHFMVNEFIMAASEDELQEYEFNYRTMILIPSSSNVSRDLSSPIYTLSFVVAVLDKTINRDSLSSIKSIEENIFVIGQLQDKLLQMNIDANFEDIELMNTLLEDYNVTTAFADFNVVLPRSPYIKSINE